MRYSYSSEDTLQPKIFGNLDLFISFLPLSFINEESTVKTDGNYDKY
jgi:hypothetical protein